MVEALCAGIIGLMVFGVGVCLAMEVIGNGMWAIVSGVLVGIVGMLCMVLAYPMYRMVFNKTKSKYAPRILELTEELSYGK